MDTGII